MKVKIKKKPVKLVSNTIDIDIWEKKNASESHKSKQNSNANSTYIYWANIRSKIKNTHKIIRGNDHAQNPSFTDQLSRVHASSIEFLGYII